jgi:hypothetical protein
MSHPLATRSQRAECPGHSGVAHLQHCTSSCAAPISHAKRDTSLGPALPLGRYEGELGARELLAVDRPDARTLVLDTHAGSLGDARVLAVLAPEEPVQNAVLLAAMYLSDATRGRCRALDQEDLLAPRDRPSHPDGASDPPPAPAVLQAGDARYAILPLTLRGGRRERRWTRVRPATVGAPRPMTLRDVVGTLEDYEPARSMTAAAIAGPAPRHVGVASLSLELARLLRSPVVLNRALREAVARHLLAGTTMSEIAIRCGRFKRDRKGHRSGETSWLARRIGQMPEGRQCLPTPWIHSDTLALIAREGLGLSPREVEL